MLERRPWPGGNIRTEEHDGIQVHMYGAHIFHTNDKNIWRYINQFAEFNHYVNSPVANYNGELYNMPFNMNTFYAMWGVTTPEEAKEYIEQNRPKYDHPPCNLEEQALSMVGYDIYNKLIKGYTEKQWGRKCTELPPEIIKRLPLRFTFDNNYFHSKYQGIPIGGYSKIIEKLLEGCEVRCNVDYLSNKESYNKIANKTMYTGALDEYFDYKLGKLDYRGLRFETECLPIENYQGVAVMNYTSSDISYTRSIEHKHFEFGTQPVTYVTKEYPANCTSSDNAFYPVNNKRNQELYAITLNWPRRK